ncbi:uncharacterized protein LOC116770977 isoform X2 [Danaus plexippus]|uniref:uncharacterized protein LOC116770977 isoform X2 n=1 Tax=Danaus plexippus TaxID=13037 RepID=UPI002AB0370E|nr:uncharacterized protein LOC116770977 isoform X2 [Danaus plexippus]
MCIPLENCCFCVSLDVGAKIISIVNLAGSTIVLMLYGTAAMLPPPVEESRKIVYAVIASVAMFELLIGCLLVYGVFGKPSLILPWLVSCYVLVLSLVSLSVLGTLLIVLQFVQNQETIKEVSTMVAFYFAVAVVLYWFGSVTNSRRHQILEGFHTGYYTTHGLLKEYRL